MTTNKWRKELVILRVEIKISGDIKEPYAVIFTGNVTEEIRQAAASLEKRETVITANDRERIIVLSPEEVCMVRVESSETVIYCGRNKYCSKKRLYELKESLGKGFMQISKSTVVNLRELDSVEPSFNGMMVLHLKNGCKDYISRKYLPEFKKYLGL
ncbi:LytTR family DNA-binding domain-containing protein [Diplocloster hominis]|uniref:LytTR family DNA-binding domain-containing protein n=1 Tax=Diplocloster hominis TaxID=3079010 RepID=UPI0031BB3704